MDMKQVVDISRNVVYNHKSGKRINVTLVLRMTLGDVLDLAFSQARIIYGHTLPKRFVVGDELDKSFVLTGAGKPQSPEQAKKSAAESLRLLGYPQEDIDRILGSK